MGSSFTGERSFMWRKARETKNGDYVDATTKEMAENMLELEKKVNDRSIVIEGSSDILTMTLGTAEHSGHIRGLGYGVKPTTYFNLPRCGSRRYSEELESKYKEECSKMKKLERKFNDLRAQMKMQK
ncbi:hypothetical protein LguiA_021806 [Lonicera macranthoides]